MLKLPKPQRAVDRKYREWVKSEGCFAQWAITLRKIGADLDQCIGPIDAHHAIPKGEGRMGSKVSDRRCVPACRWHHDFVEARPSLFRELFEDLIERLNSDYDAKFPPKPAREYVRVPHVQHLLVLCACGRVHRLPVSKITLESQGVQYYCPFLKKDQMASFRRLV